MQEKKIDIDLTFLYNVEIVKVYFIHREFSRNSQVDKTRYARKMRSSRKRIYCFAVRSRAKIVRSTIYFYSSPSNLFSSFLLASR